MRIRYICLILTNGEAGIHQYREAEARLSAAGMVCVLESSRLRLFRSVDTPAIPLPGDGVLLGDIFHATSGAIDLAATFEKHGSTTKLIDSILKDYWGEYLLFLPSTERADRLTVLRDPSGAVPCVYSTGPAGGFITSDVTLAIEAGLYRRRVDWDAIPYCLAYPHIKTGQTALANVRELLPGCQIDLQGDGAQEVRQAWSPWVFVSSRNRHSDLNEAAADVGDAIRRVVSSFAPIDEPILLELSGGLDSSIVASSLHDAGARTVCHTLVTPVPGADERLYAGLVARHLGLDLHVEDLSLDYADFDFVPPPHSVAPRLGPLQRAIDVVMQSAGDRHGIRCFYSGGGGDTVFSYLKTAAPAADAIMERGFREGLSSIRDLSQLHQCTLWKACKLTVRKLARHPKDPCKFDCSFLNPSKLPDQSAHHPWFEAPERALPGDRERIFELAGTQTFRDCFPRGDKRQLRMPLLSQPVVESCLRVPSWMWIEGGTNRAVARAAFKNALPSESLSRRSKGTFLNYLGVVYRNNKDQMRHFLTSGELAERALVERDAICSFMDGVLPPRDQSFTRILELCMVENWLRHQS